MADIQEGPGGNTSGGGGEGAATENQNNAPSGGGPASTQATGNEGGQADGGADGADSEGSQGGEGLELDPDKHDVPVRDALFVKDKIIERKDSKIDKLENQQQGEGSKGDSGEPKGAPELKPEARGVIEEVVRDALNPVLGTVKTQADKAEISQHVADNPEQGKYAPIVQKYMKTKGWEGVPASFIFNALAAKESGGADPQAQAKAKERAKQTAAGGGSGSARDLEGGGKLPNPWELSDEEFKSLQNKVKRGEKV